MFYRSITESATEDDLRGKIRAILSCDTSQQNPLYPSIFPQFDVVSSTFCLEAIFSAPPYTDVIKNVATLLKPGGWMILYGVLNQNFYRFGKFKFPTVPISAGEIQKSWPENGFTIKEWREQDVEENSLYDASATFGMVCRKL